MSTFSDAFARFRLIFTITASPLTVKEQHQEFISVLTSVCQLATQQGDDALKNKMLKVIENAEEHIFKSADPKKLAFTFAAILANNGSSSIYPDNKVEFEKLGEPVEDRLYFLLLKQAHKLPNGTKKTFWNDVLSFTHIGTGEYKRRRNVVDAIRQAALQAAGQPANCIISPDLSIDSLRLMSEIANESISARAFWDKACELNLHYELTTLIQQGKIAIFPPYFQSDSNNFESLKEYLREAIKKHYENANRSVCRRGFFGMEPLFPVVKVHQQRPEDTLHVTLRLRGTGT